MYGLIFVIQKLIIIIKSCEEDLWIEIAKHLDGKSLVMLAATCHWLKRIMMEECIWKFACVRDLVQVPDPKKVAFKWIKLYAAAFGKKATLPLCICSAISFYW